MLASLIGQFGHPFYVAVAWLLAAFYSLVANYALAIALLTLLVMIITYPITLRATRATLRMQLMAPELKKIQQTHKARPALSIEERAKQRERQQTETLAVYAAHNVKPLGGLLPFVVQFPIFLVLYGTIRGLVHQHIVNGVLSSNPLYISHGSKIYLAIQQAHGQLVSFGVNLADSLRTPGQSSTATIVFIMMIALATGLQYLQLHRASGRSTSKEPASPLLQRVQRIAPLIFAAIYVSIPAAVNVYFIVSSVFRIVQQELIYRRDPEVQTALVALGGGALASGG